MRKDEKGPNEIRVKDLYMGRIEYRFKNPMINDFIGAVFYTREKKKRRKLRSFSISFEDTKLSWYSNFLNDFVGKTACFFTKKNDMFIVYPVFGKKEAKPIILPEEREKYTTERAQEWERGEKQWKIDPSLTREEKAEDSYLLRYQGEQKENPNIKIFEHTLFRGIDKVVLQAFVKKDNRDAFLDIENIAKSIIFL